MNYAPIFYNKSSVRIRTGINPNDKSIELFFRLNINDSNTKPMLVFFKNYDGIKANGWITYPRDVLTMPYFEYSHTVDGVYDTWRTPNYGSSNSEQNYNWRTCVLGSSSSYYTAGDGVLMEPVTLDEMKAIASDFYAGELRPITYMPTNCAFTLAPSEAAAGTEVIVQVKFPEGYTLGDISNIYVTDNGTIVPSVYDNGTLTFTMPYPSNE